MKGLNAGWPLLFITLLSCRSQSQDHTPTPVKIQRRTALSTREIKALDSVDIHFQIRGHCYAFNSPSNAVASNGEAHSGNLAKPVDNSFPRRGVYLEINESEFVKIDSNYLGCKLYLVNTSGNNISLDAQDSRLYIGAEALNEKNEWVPISYFPSSWCGNSYHTVMLGKNEYWSFIVPVFKGTFKTKLRYSLFEKGKVKLSSNEIIAWLNKEQFDSGKKQGHQSSGLMDSYED